MQYPYNCYCNTSEINSKVILKNAVHKTWKMLMGTFGEKIQMPQAICTNTL